MQSQYTSIGDSNVAGAAGAMVPAQLSAPARDYVAGPTNIHSEPANDLQPLQLLHRHLRGHYTLVIALGVLFGGAGAMLGWTLPKPMYRSEGLIQIRYAQPAADPTLAQTPFDVFMESQKTLITSRRVIDKALEDPAWKALGVPVTDQSHRVFASKLDVEARHGTEYLKISFTDFDPGVAARAVQATTSAYAGVYRDDEQHLKTARMNVLMQTRTELSARILQMQAEIDEVIKKYGAADLSSFHNAAIQRTTRLDSAIEDIKVAIASLDTPGSSVATVQPSKTKSTNAKPLTPAQLAQTDSVMRTYLDEQRNCEQRLEVLKLRGYGDNYPEVIFVKSTLEKATQHVEQYLQEYKTIEAPATLGSPSIDKLNAEAAKLASMRVKAHEEMVELAEAQVRQALRDARLKKDREALDTINKKIDDFEDQDQMGGRLTVINAGEIPLSPTLDRRFKVSAGSAAIGFLLPSALIGLQGLFWRRFRYADETIRHSAAAAPLLGIIPTLDGNPEQSNWDITQSAYAAQQVHQIRIMLQTGMPGTQSASYLITSATAGEGKTSLTMALGLSFAATGLRTLVIDSDLAGQQLSHGIEADKFAGLHEALRKGTIQGFLRRVQGGLCVLPVGNARAFDACAISSASFKRLLAESRQYFDTILIDSGPVLGSVEASVLAQEVDGVVFAISRGQQPPVVERAMKHLASLGAKVSGLVFNRAKSADFYGSRYASSSKPLSPLEVETDRTTAGRCRLGPLVAAVLSSLPKGQQPALT